MDDRFTVLGEAHYRSGSGSRYVLLLEPLELLPDRSPFIVILINVRSGVLTLRKIKNTVVVPIAETENTTSNENSLIENMFRLSYPVD